jgi:hypothetical protein
MTFYEAVICDNGQKNIKKGGRPSDLSPEKLPDNLKKRVYRLGAVTK